MTLDEGQNGGTLNSTRCLSKQKIGKRMKTCRNGEEIMAVLLEVAIFGIRTSRNSELGQRLIDGRPIPK